MPSTYSNLKIQLMATGENTGTWGNVTNDNLGVAIEQALVETATVTFSSANVTLTLTDTNAAQNARALRLNLTGTTGGARDLIVPAIQKPYIVNNGTADIITIKVSGQTGVAIPAGKSIIVYNNGTDVVSAFNYVAALDSANITSLNLTVDNINIDGNTISSTDTNGNIVLSPNGSGDVQLSADTVQIGDSNANATLTTNGTGDLILNTNNGTNSGSITIQDAANGNIVLAPNGSGRVQVSGTSTNSAGIELFEDTDNGTNKALLTVPAALGSDITVTLPDITSTLGFRNIPQSGSDKTTSYTLEVGDVGEFVGVGSGGSITIPNSTFATGDAVSIFNNTTGNVTITCSITTAYIAGTDSDKATMTLASRGVATVLFVSGTVCVVTGNVT